MKTYFQIVATIVATFLCLTSWFYFDEIWPWIRVPFVWVWLWEFIYQPNPMMFITMMASIASAAGLLIVLYKIIPEEIKHREIERYLYDETERQRKANIADLYHRATHASTNLIKEINADIERKGGFNVFLNPTNKASAIRLEKIYSVADEAMRAQERVLFYSRDAYLLVIQVKKVEFVEMFLRIYENLRQFKSQNPKQNSKKVVNALEFICGNFISRISGNDQDIIDEFKLLLSLATSDDEEKIVSKTQELYQRKINVTQEVRNFLYTHGRGYYEIFEKAKEVLRQRGEEI